MLFNCGNVQNIVADRGHLEAELHTDGVVKAALMRRAALVSLTFDFSYHLKSLK